VNIIGTWMLRFAFACGLVSFILIVFKKDAEVRKNLGILTGLVSCFGVLVSSALLFYSLVKGIFSVEYVYHNTEKTLPLIYKISAFWSGSAGSMLLWTSMFAVLLIVVYFKKMDKSSTKTVFAVLTFIMTLFMVVVTFINNPFKNVSQQTDGFGLNPALQSIGMVFHPPIIIFAFSLFFLAFCYQLFDLKEDKPSNGFIIWKLTIVGWILLTAGIVSGGVWAYTELGWGGYWAWDPIENSSLVNWLFATAFLHGISKKDFGFSKKRLNFILITMTAFTILVGTFIARSGLLKSVHAYSSQGVTRVFGGALIFLAVVIVFIYFRIKRLHKNNNKNETEETGSKLKEICISFIKSQNLFTTLCIAIAVLIFGGTAFPLIGGVTPIEFYEYSFGIFGLLVLLVLAICPRFFSERKVLLIPGAVIGLTVLIIMIAFYKYSILTNMCLAICAMLVVNIAIELIRNHKKILSNPRHISFVILHASLIILALGLAGSKGMSYSTEKMLEKSDAVAIQEYSVKFRNLYWKEEEGKTTAVAVIGVSGPKGKFQLKPELSYYTKMEKTHSRAVIKAGLKEDLYIIFEGIDENDRISIKVMVLKWVSFVWIGSILLIVGVLLEYYLKRKQLVEDTKTRL